MVREATMDQLAILDHRAYKDQLVLEVMTVAAAYKVLLDQLVTLDHKAYKVQ